MHNTGFEQLGALYTHNRDDIYPTWCKVWKYTPLLDYTRVDCVRPRIYLGVDHELYPRGRLRRLP